MPEWIDIVIGGGLVALIVILLIFGKGGGC